MAASDVHQHGGDVDPSERVKEGLVRLPLRGPENITCTPSLRGGRANVQCVGTATR